MESKKRNQYAYDKKAYDHLHIQLKKGKKDEVQVHAQQFGKSLNGFINEAIDEKIQRDNEKSRPLESRRLIAEK